METPKPPDRENFPPSSDEAPTRARKVGARRALAVSTAPTPCFEFEGARDAANASTAECPSAAESQVDASGGPTLRAEGSAAENVSWRPWLAGATPREVLSRIVQDDPLHVRERVATALREGAYLLDADQVQLRSLALVARHAARYRGRPEFGAWLDGLVAEAVQSILREEAERDCSLDVGNEDRGRGADACRERSAAHETLVPAVFLALAKPLGLEPAAMGRACAAFNRLPTTDRTAFFALVLDSRSLDELARESGESATEIARRARRGLDAILSVSSSDGGALPHVSGDGATDGNDGNLSGGGLVS